MRSMRGGGNEPRRGTSGDRGQLRSIQSADAAVGRPPPLVFQPRQPAPGALSVSSQIALALRRRYFFFFFDGFGFVVFDFGFFGVFGLALTLMLWPAETSVVFFVCRFWTATSPRLTVTSV